MPTIQESEQREELVTVNRPQEPRERLIVALDFQSLAPAVELIDRLGESVLWYKVGMELFYADGPRVLSALHERKKRIFLDLKLHDIPNTMAQAFRSLAIHGVGLTTVHITAGEAALSAVAQEARVLRAAGNPAPLVLGVTRLTSLATPDPRNPWEDVVRLAGVAVQSGIDGWIAPVAAAKLLRESHGPGPILTCPGIRLPEGATQDQVEIGTPEAAIAAGADWIVVGRPITRAEQPAEATREFLRRLGER